MQGFIKKSNHYLNRREMENTLENKAKFFAQYWGQEVFSKTHGATTHILDYVRLGSISDISVIELKPLSQISDEDAIEVAKICLIQAGEYDNTVSDYELLNYCHTEYIQPNEYLRFTPQYILDFLRSRGYALPWMGLSVDKLIEYGWIKLKED